MFIFLLCSLPIYKIEVCLNLNYILFEGRELYRKKNFVLLKAYLGIKHCTIIAHLKPRCIRLQRKVKVDQVHLPDLGEVFLFNFFLAVLGCSLLLRLFSGCSVQASPWGGFSCQAV